jgi:hypothetical protein
MIKPLNSPTGGVALVLLFCTLHFNPLERRLTFREWMAEFDFAGLVLLLGGVICLLLGFNQSETSCKRT